MEQLFSYINNSWLNLKKYCAQYLVPLFCVFCVWILHVWLFWLTLHPFTWWVVLLMGVSVYISWSYLVENWIQIGNFPLWSHEIVWILSAVSATYFYTYFYIWNGVWYAFLCSFFWLGLYCLWIFLLGESFIVWEKRPHRVFILRIHLVFIWLWLHSIRYM